MTAMFQKGDKVAALDDDVAGTVSRVDGERIFVETADGFEIAYFSTELIKVLDTSILNSGIGNISSREIAAKADAGKKRLPAPTRVRGDIPPPEFDLHIEKLVRNPKVLSQYDILTLQSETARRHVDFAIRNRIPKIVLIHGVGEGILKAELDFMLSRYDNLSYRDADYRKYGVGATEITFKQSGKHNDGN